MLIQSVLKENKMATSTKPMKTVEECMSDLNDSLRKKDNIMHDMVEVIEAFSGIIERQNEDDIKNVEPLFIKQTKRQAQRVLSEFRNL